MRERTGAAQAARLVAFAVAVIMVASTAWAQTPPTWNGGTPLCGVWSTDCVGGTAIKPAVWPSDAQWIPYSWGTTYPDVSLSDKHPIRDQRTLDPSNGGARPQNYVNVSSGCPDQTLPSIYYYFDPAGDSGNGMIYFRWRVEQIANNYAIGPSAGPYGSTDPWSSALWTVFLDLDGNGYRNFAMHLNGSSGAPATPVDIVRSIWSNANTNSIDYIGSPADIHSLFVNPTGFATATGGPLYQFSGGTPAAIQWPNGASETTWDYGTTRSINISTGACEEYFVDYQIPVRMLNASAFSGPTMSKNTPFQFLFATANSLNDPFQKDVVWEGNFVCDASSPGPFGDALTLAHGIIPQPIATSITASAPNSCSVFVSAQIMDALTVTNCATINQLVQAQFKYYYDVNGNGVDDDGGTWVNIGDPTTPVGTTVTANWNILNLIQGQYLIALEITDNRGHTTQTWMGKASGPLEQSFGTDLGGPGGTTRHLYTNVPPFEPTYAYAGLQPATLGISYAKVQVGGACGKPVPTITKTPSNTTPQQGTAENYTFTIDNTQSATTITVSQLNDTLPAGFTYQGNSGTLGAPSTAPSVGATGALTFTWSPAVSVAGGTSKTFVVQTNAGTTGGNFYNSGSFTTSVGVLTGTDGSGVNVKTAALTVTKSIALSSAPGVPITSCNRNDSVVFTMVVANNSATATSATTVTDALPAGFTYVSASPAPTSAPGVGTNGTVTWSGRSFPTSGAGQTQTFTITAIATIAGSFTNTVNVTDPAITPVSASANLFVAGPILSITKTASTNTVTRPGSGTTPVTYTIEYANVGNQTANLTYLGDTYGTPAIPTGWAFTTAGSSGNCNGPDAVAVITINSGGSGYTSAPTVNIGGPGAGAAATATITAGVVTAITITNPGTGYTSAPAITFSGGGGGSGASATATVFSGVACTNLGTLGAGATVTRTLVFNVGTTAALTTQTNTASINATNAATQTATFNTLVQTTTCTNTNYFFRSTTGAVSTGANGYAVGYANMTSNGTGYTSAPAVAFSGGGGTGAAGTAVGNSTGGVAGVNITAGGSGYTSAPTITLTGGGGTGAAATAVLTDNQRLALTTQGASDTTATITVKTLTELARFYSDPVDTTTAYLLSSASVTTFWDNPVPNGSKVKYTITLNDWDSVNNTLTLIASTGAKTQNNGGQFTDAFTVPANTILKANHRLLWIISVEDPNGNANTTDTLHFNGPTLAQTSYGTVCLSPVRISITKSSNKLSVSNSGSDTISYTVTVNNPSSVAIPGTLVYDPLPAGLSLTSTTPSTGTVTTGTANCPTVSSTQCIQWNIGSLAAGASVTLTINANVLSSITGSSVTNTATVTDNYTPNQSASISAVIASPNVLISKVSSGNNFVPGDKFSYTIAVVNTGTGAASSVTVTDTIASYLTPLSYTTSATSVASIAVTNGGSGYTSAPAVSFSSGTATATAIVSGGQVTAVLITNGGSGYASAPTISFSGGGGSGAAATAQLAGTLTSTTLVGSAFTFNVGSLGAGATTLLNITVQVASSGVPAGTTPVVNTASVTDSYNPTPRTASVTVQITANPVLTLIETATPSANRVVFVNVTAGGSYPTPPTVSISGNGCTGVTAIVNTNPVGALSGPYTVTGVTITNPGSGCTGTPSVTFSGSGGAAATATIGPAPGDTITYLLTLSNTGNADASNCVINGTVPVNTSYTSGGTFSSGSVSSSPVTIIPGANTQLTYVVTVNSSLPYSYSSPFGVTALPQSGTATSSNAAAPAPVSVSLNTGTSPKYTITDTPDGNTYADPLTTIPSNAINVSTFNVADASLLSIGSYVAIPNGAAYQVVEITAKSGNTITTSSAITAAAGANVLPVELYTLAYGNSGGGNGQNVVVSDILPSGLFYAGTPISSVARATIVSGGSGYATAPSVTISGSGCTGATGTAVISGGAVTGVIITSGGSGCTGNPTISFSGGGGSGASANAVLVAPVPNSAPSIGSTGTVSWNVGTLNSGATGTVQFLAFPSAAGTYTNTGIITDGTALNDRNAYDQATTTFGALNPTKSTTTPEVIAGSGVAHYVITVTNPLSTTTASNVAVVDNLPTGFTYKAGSTVINGTPASDPCSGCVAGIRVDAGGSGYTSAPAVSFSGGGGSGAAGTANISAGVVRSITITSGGTGYTSAPAISFSAGGGSGASATALVPTPTVPVWGGLSIAPSGTLTIAFDANVSANVPTGTYNNEIIVSGSIPSLTFDYLGTTAEDVHVCASPSPITAPTACANSTGNVASIAFRPTATYSWSINNGAIITNSSTGTVNSITVGSGGSGYGAAPTVTISGGGGSGATATATVSGGVVTAVTITNPGSGYTSVPTVSFSSGTATAAAVLGTGIVYTAGTTSPTITVTATEDTCSLVSTATPSVVGPVITAQPQDVTYCTVPTTISMSITASGSPSYQWQLDTGSGFNNAPNGGIGAVGTGVGANTATYQYRADATTSGYKFRVLLSASSCSVTSNTVTITSSCNPDLQMTTDTGSPNPVYAGENLVYTQQFTNISTQDTNSGFVSTIVWEPIPANTTYVSSSVGSGTNGFTCLNTTNGVVSIAIVSGGSGYATAPTVNFSGGGGSGAAATATISGGVVTAITITNPGTGYTSAPSVGFSSGAASATATVGAALTCTTTNVTNSGALSPVFTLTVKVDPATPDGTVITNTVRVTTPNDSNPNNNFTTTTNTVQRRIDVQTATTDNANTPPYGPHFIYPGNPPTPQNLTWTTVVANGGPSQGTNVVVTDPMPAGFSYSSSSITGAGNSCSYSSATQTLTCTIANLAPTPAVWFTGGTGGTSATASVSGGAVTAITVNPGFGGSGYTIAPEILLAGGGGTGARAIATITGGVVTGFTITNPGTGYTSAPTVYFAGGGGTPSAVATVSGGAVTGYTITSGGSGYTSAPTVFINVSGGSGSGATAIPTISGGSLTALAVNAAGSGYTNTPVIQVLGTTTVDTQQITDAVTVTYNETDLYPANDPSSDTVSILAPTLVKMLTMNGSINRKNGAVTLTWQTSFEQDNLGFHVWRETADGKRTELTTHIITGSALQTAHKVNTVRSYRFVDPKPPAGFAQYYVEDVDLKGVRTLHGPVAPRVSTYDVSGGPETDPDPGLGSVGGIFTTPAGFGVTPAAPAATPDTRLAQQWLVANSNAAKLVITQNGWYRVSRADLTAAGFDPGAVSSRLSLFADGIEVPILVNDGGDGSFDPADTIEFYGTAIDTPTAGGHIYFVTLGKGKTLRITKQGAAKGGAASPASYPYTFSRIERTVFFSALTNNGDNDNFFGAVVTTWPVSENLTVTNLDPNSASAQVQLVIQGATDNFDHVISVTLNGHEIGPIAFRSQARSVSNISVPVSYLVDGENTLTFTATTNWDDVSVVESAKISYQHLFKADNGALAFTVAGGTQVSVSGFAATDTVSAFDLTDPLNQVALTVTASNGTATITAPGSVTRSILVIGSSRIQAPLQAVLNQPSKWNATTNAAKMVIISNRAFLDSANALKAARDAQGIPTQVIDVQNLYDEFSFGAHSPYAIRDFLKRSASWSTPPHYVILLGDSSFDPRNYYGMGNYDYVPTKLVPTYYLKTASDDWFADFNDTGIPSLAIGRIAVRTAAEAQTVIGKLTRRPAAPPSDPWAQKVEIISDAPVDAPFEKGADQLVPLVPQPPYTVDRIRLQNASSTAVMDAYNNGSLILNYLGHGSVEVWDNGSFSTSAAYTLTNGDRLPFVITMNCLNGHFHDLFTESIAEGLLKSTNGGAIGVWASSALTTPDQQWLMNMELYRQIFNTNQSIGDAVIKAKSATQDKDVRKTFILFGDPTLRLH